MVFTLGPTQNSMRCRHILVCWESQEMVTCRDGCLNLTPNIRKKRKPFKIKFNFKKTKKWEILSYWWRVCGGSQTNNKFSSIVESNFTNFSISQTDFGEVVSGDPTIYNPSSCRGSVPQLVGVRVQWSSYSYYWVCLTCLHPLLSSAGIPLLFLIQCNWLCERS